LRWVSQKCVENEAAAAGGTHAARRAQSLLRHNKDADIVHHLVALFDRKAVEIEAARSAAVLPQLESAKNNRYRTKPNIRSTQARDSRASALRATVEGLEKALLADRGGIRPSHFVV
jgi:hypothetical protein